jgi:hypothetical protein
MIGIHKEPDLCDVKQVGVWWPPFKFRDPAQMGSDGAVRHGFFFCTLQNRLETWVSVTLKWSGRPWGRSWMQSSTPLKFWSWDGKDSNGFRESQKFGWDFCLICTTFYQSSPILFVVLRNGPITHLDLMEKSIFLEYCKTKLNYLCFRMLIEICCRQFDMKMFDIFVLFVVIWWIFWMKYKAEILRLDCRQKGKS